MVKDSLAGVAPTRSLLIKSLLLGLYLIPCLAFPGLILYVDGGFLSNSLLRVGIFSLFVMLGIAVYRILNEESGWLAAALLTTLFYAVVYKAADYIPDVSIYPLSMGWSEASRYYYASLFFSQRIYSMSVPPSVLHVSRYLLESIPFLIPNTSIWVHRLWQVFLWIGAAGATSYLLARRLSLKKARSRWGMVFLGFLFLLAAPVYYHLLVMVILVLWGFDRWRPVRTALIVMLASAWAGISRINWVPVPAMLVAALYFLEQEIGDRPLRKYLLPPVAWFLSGSLIGLLVEKGYELFSGNPIYEFGSSFTSNLLWYRLFPNVTYPLGILLSLALFSFPLVLVLLLRLYSDWGCLHWLRLTGLAGILITLLAGGLIVSLKIGGGSNLHNMDAFLTLLLVIGAYVIFDHYPRDASGPRRELLPISALFGLVVAVPVLFTVLSGGQAGGYDFTQAQEAIQIIRARTQAAAQKGGQVLFIRERQLLTFGEIPGVRLVPDDEVVFLQEMAMANNRPYLSQFYTDLKNHRFALIVSDPLSTHYQGRSHSFGEENDAWVSRVSEPILCYYETVETIPQVGIVLMAPRAQDCQ